MRPLRPAAAAIVLSAILACSGLGTCWKQFARSAHDCCENESAMAPAKTCASAVAQTVAVDLVAPSAIGWTVFSTAAVESAEPSAAAFAPAFPVKSPPLVLRI
jgi:hypothetical protein